MKSIRTKILGCMAATVLVSLLLIGGISIYLNYNSTVDTLHQTMLEMSVTASERVAKELDSYKNIAHEVGSNAVVADPAVSVEEKKTIIDQRTSHYGLLRGNVIDANGISIFDGNDYSERDYFKKSINGTTAVSEPLISKITGDLTIIISAPL